MSVAFGLVLALAGAAVANPIVNLPARTASPATITAAPATIKARQASVTTIPVSSCINFSDPDNDSAGGCECSGYSSILPYLTDDSCSYSQVVTVGPTSSSPWIFTTTQPNNAIVAYDQTTIYPGASTPDGAGDSTTLQAGTQVTLQMAPTSSVNVGALNGDAGASSLYTAISNNLVTACPTPTSGQTITSCSSVAAVTGVSYIDEYSDLKTDGNLDISVELISVTDANSLQVLIGSICAGILGNAQVGGNTASASYFCDSCWDDSVPGDLPTVNLTNVPAIYESIVSVEDETTNGQVAIQDLEVTLALAGGADGFTCSDASLVLSAMAALGAIIPGFGFLSLGAVGSVGRFGLSAGCDFSG